MNGEAPNRPRGRWRNTIATVAVLLPVVAVVLYTSFGVSVVECEVCMRFDGRDACRKVTAATREEALRGAVDNACALIASGMTATMRCSRSEPVETRCRAL